ncbi:TIGR00730 family Rossman fold protein [Pigmentiphaga sp.]|uniref:LOG family protein n=1 Tax=Pigmentiphaga sp. TaxID=1977564 RepID=UPI00128BAEB9|nr:TIGR00730 family Rossman fold protein [Pigmentiphaga sp.]MPS25310.1 TIGR00730 family Rossman fold protein [Alcaligenaceae bacterium SAGV5]MPS55027.1 TIGR00730 family Rossman fold protein [Alcaligenaceae bacterium SAGV3]MPT59036.1 TIGR00730 family Rossman fold protein [Alcaligenaceae bacterium]
MDAVCVYCGASAGSDPFFAEVARDFGRAVARRGMRLVYGGGSVGLMGHVANAALETGGQVTGVIPERLWEKEVGHKGLTDMYVVPTMHARKARMVELSDAFVALPGGFGTLDELFEVLTWQQIGYHSKPVGLLNANGYYDALLAFARHAHEQGFVRAVHLEALIVDTDIDRLLDRLASAQPVHVDRWVKNSDAV